MLVLGWHGGLNFAGVEDSSSGFAQHDAAAVILRDGRIVAAIEDERLNRVKHSNFFPLQAIRFCLAEAGVTLADLDAIVTDVGESLFNGVALVAAMNDPALPIVTGKDKIAGLFERGFGVDVRGKVHFCSHHLAHLYGCWYPSGFSDALAVCLDGEGDGLSGLVANCSASQIDILRRLPEAHSLGNFYTRMISQLGYRRFDEYKSMGLAPYGNPAVYEALFKRMYRLLPEGQFTIAPDEEKWGLLMEAGALTQARRKNQPFTQQHKDFAAALQATLERIVEHVIEHFKRATNARHLCLSGGVAHNCTMNGRILRSRRFEEIYVQPAAHDAGNALGAALWLTHEAGRPVPRNGMSNLYWGSDIGSADQIGERLAAWGPFVQATRVADAPTAAANAIAGGSVIAWVQGRSEFGPRALGNRSILADPRPATNKDRINAMVKKREGFRPFAPSVLEERLHDFFDLPDNVKAIPFMVITVPVRQEARSVLGAVTHVDGSARVQSVSPADNPRYHALIEAFGRSTGVPIVLNTSFNNDAEPIIDSVDDAVACFLTTGIDILFIGDWQVTKMIPANARGWLDLAPHLSQCRKLVQRQPKPDGANCFVESTASSYFGSSAVPVSPALFRLLLDDDGTPARQRCERVGIVETTEFDQLGAELFDLWQRRSVRMAPAA